MIQTSNISSSQVNPSQMVRALLFSQKDKLMERNTIIMPMEQLTKIPDASPTTLSKMVPIADAQDTTGYWKFQAIFKMRQLIKVQTSNILVSQVVVLRTESSHNLRIVSSLWTATMRETVSKGSQPLKKIEGVLSMYIRNLSLIGDHIGPAASLTWFINKTRGWLRRKPWKRVLKSLYASPGIR